jgi:LemA protein
MKKIGIIIGAVTGVIAITLGVMLITGYNGLVTRKQDIGAKESQIEIRLQERHDKITMIVAAVNGLEDYALDVYQMITEAREAYATAHANEDFDGLVSADALESVALTNLIAVVEDNPNIDVTSAYTALIDEISSIESALAVARRDYNTSVLDYNNGVQTFPNIVYASIFGFDKEIEYWKMNDGADEIPAVVFE